MPPFDLNPGQKALLPHWGSITAAAFQGLNTAETFSAIYNARVAAGEDPGVIRLSDLNPIRSLAVGWRRSTEAFATEQNTTALRGDLVAQAPWSRSLYQQSLSPFREVRYQYLTVGADGEQRAQWTTIPHEDTGILNTVGNVRSLVEEHSRRIAEGGGSPPLEEDESFVGIGNIMVVAI